MTERVADYRGSTPIYCRCGRALIVETHHGTWDCYGPADLALAAEYGITTEGPIQTIWESWSCPASGDGSPHDYGPILIAGGA